MKKLLLRTFLTAMTLLTVSLLGGGSAAVPESGVIRGAGLPAPPVPPPAQPLLANAARLGEALGFLGQPLPAKARALLIKAAATDSDADAARLVQQALDPLCLTALEIPASGSLRISPNRNCPPLLQQGWQTYLVKVINTAGVTNPLRIVSPNARPVPGSAAAEVRNRWLDIAPFYHRPLTADLSGLGLEYQVVQLYCRDAGTKTATLAFDAGVKSDDGGKSVSAPPSSVRAWRFEKGTDGWSADKDAEAAATGGQLVIRTTGGDPFLSAPVRLSGGTMRLRLHLTASHDDLMQVFWATEDAPDFSGARQAVFALQKSDVPREYTATFPVTGDLTRLRLDPGSAKGIFKIDWIELVCVDGPTNWAKASFTFPVQPSATVTFRVRDEAGKPATAAFLIRDSQGRIYPAQSKRLAPDFFFQPQIYRANGGTVQLPVGTYSVACSRGPESLGETRTLTVGNQPQTFDYRVKRWIDPARRGWWSGDHHIHAAGCLHYSNPTQGVLPADMALHLKGEDVKVGCNLTWGPCFDFQKQFFSGKTDRASTYPYLLRYDIEVSGFGSAASGHLCLLGLTQQIPDGGTSDDHWPTLGLNTLRWAKKQGAVCGTAHSALGLTRFVDRLPYADGPLGLPTYAIPAFDGVGANEYIMDVTHRVPGPGGTSVPAVDFLATMNTDPAAELNIWYHTLNCGFRTRISGETDFPCISGDRVGRGRVYVKQTGKLTFDGWVRGLQQGRSYVSDGRYHLIDYRASAGRATVRVGEKNSELKLSTPGTVRLQVTAAALDPARKNVPVEVIVNGYPVQAQSIPTDGKERNLTFTVPVSQSSWVAVRTFPHSHTNPIFVMVGGKGIRASRRSAEWCLRGVDQCWEQKKNQYAAGEQKRAASDYEHARRVYRRIASESKSK